MDVNLFFTFLENSELFIRHIHTANNPVHQPGGQDLLQNAEYFVFATKGSKNRQAPFLRDLHNPFRHLFGAHTVDLVIFHNFYAARNCAAVYLVSGKILLARRREACFHIAEANGAHGYAKLL